MWWLLIVTARPAGERDAFDDVGIQRSLREELGAAELPRLGLEHVDERAADELALGLGIGDAGEARQESVAGVYVDQRDVVMLAEQADDLFGFALPQQAVIDEDAGQLVADRLVDEQRRDRRIDSARQAAEHAFAADLGADFGDLGGAEARHRPCRIDPGNVLHEVGEKLAAVGGVDDLGVELHAVAAGFVTGDGGERRAVRDGDGAVPGRDGFDPVAMAHPDLVALALRPDAVEERAVGGDVDEGAAEFAVGRDVDLAAGLRAQGLFAVADAEDRHVGGKNCRRNLRRANVGGRCRAARQNNRTRGEPGKGLAAAGERDDLAIDPRLADTAGDQLGDLAAEIENEDRVAGRHQSVCRHRRRLRPPARRVQTGPAPVRVSARAAPPPAAASVAAWWRPPAACGSGARSDR